MPIIVKKPESDFVPAPEGLHGAVCVDVVDLGVLQTQWGDKPKIRIAWQIEARDEDTGKRYLVSQQYTRSLHEKATLTHHLESWRGRKFSEQELLGFDLETILGVNCQLTIVHNEGSKGGTFANVSAIAKAHPAAAHLNVEGYVRVKDRDASEPESVSPPPEADSVPF